MSARVETLYDVSLNRKDRVTYTKVFMRPPALNADIQNTAESVNAIVDQEFEILGTNAVSTDATISTKGGVQISAHSTTNDSTIILPHLDASQSAWATTLWDTAKSPSFETLIETSSTIATQVIWAGFKLTNTPTAATDDDQAYFVFDTSATNSTKFTYNYSIAGTDYVVVPSLDVQAIVAVSTRYKLRVEVYSDRTHMGFINDRPVGSANFAALTSLTTQIPYIGIKSLSAAAKTCIVKYIECGRAH